jgi:hypothetical protein
MLQGQWKGIVWPADEMAERDPPTGIARTVLEKIGRASVTIPSGFVRPFLANDPRLDGGDDKHRISTPDYIAT